MYRLLIADDEDDERKGIRFLLNRGGFEFQVREAVDGKEALAMLRDEPADILLTDVKMPFLSGIELATEARKCLPDIQLIFFSGYDDFEYVKQALSLQAVDYILKPVNPEEFNRVIRTVTDRMRAEEERDCHNRRFHKHYLLTRLLNRTPLTKLIQRREEAEFLYRYTRLILMEFEEDFFGREASDMKEFAGCFTDIFPKGYDFLDLNPMQAIFFLKDTEEDTGAVKERCRQLLQKIEAGFRRSCYLSISPKFEKPEEIGAAYDQAEQYLEERFFSRDLFIYPLNGEKGSGQEGEAGDSQLLERIKRDIEGRDVYSLRRDVSVLLDKYRGNRQQSYIYVRFICSSLLSLLCCKEKGEALTSRIEKIYACTGFDQIEEIIGEALAELEEDLTPGEELPARAIALVEQYIRAHYEEPLSLDLLAEKVYLTPHYLSSIFIQEKGIGINKYIKNLRMEKARELLTGTNMKISEICERVGYSNLSYFCRTFRNEFGMTPEQYRR